MLDIVQDTNLQPWEDIQAESSGARLEEISNNKTVRINFKIRGGGIRKPASTIVRGSSLQLSVDGCTGFITEAQRNLVLWEQWDAWLAEPNVIRPLSSAPN